MQIMREFRDHIIKLSFKKVLAKLDLSDDVWHVIPITNIDVPAAAGDVVTVEYVNANV